ncbi:heparin-binding hemagglutinin [Nocardia alba]|uniref:Heparin binding hemagglutinin HbhA n=1 Tax=Nocardia alba TaxID=225051 RepID=A0A4R1FXD1_9NOCA|nr:heparin-binding hemagglutinin [Nocardia alba]TCK00267.1 heparin binding hemagglutinin HbhA [Nocardia alba]
MTEKTATVTKPLFATVGAGDAIYAAVNDVVADVRGRVVGTDAKARVEEARERIANVPADVQAQFDTLRDRISGLPSELPEDLAELREKFTPEELRKLAEQYYRQALDIYADLAVRGEETVDRLRANQAVDEQIGRVETLYKDASARAEDALTKVNDLLGRTKAEAQAVAEVVAEEVDAVVEAEVVAVTTEPAPAKAPAAPAAKKAPAKKAPAKKAAAPKTV